jgi:hypothetical protein
LIDSWLKDVDSGKYIGTVFLDLQKAFDLVDHESSIGVGLPPRLRMRGGHFVFYN